MRRKGRMYTAIACACAVVFSSVSVCAADTTSNLQAQEELAGDIDQNGIVDIRDLMRCLNHVSQKTLLSAEQQKLADVDENGRVDIQDLMLLLNYVSGKSNTPLGHNYDKTVEVTHVDSTCSTKGYVEYKCKNCGALLREELPIDPEKHNYVLTSSDLTYNYYSCSGCGDSYQEYNDQKYTIDLGNGKTTTVIGHYDIEMAKEIGRLVNERRVNAGYNTLTICTDASTNLGQAALIRGPELCILYEHIRPNGERAIHSFYSMAATDGENIAIGQKSAQEVFMDWVHSPGHDENQLRDIYKNIGIAAFAEKKPSGRYKYSFVQLFSTRSYNI